MPTSSPGIEQVTEFEVKVKIVQICLPIVIEIFDESEPKFVPVISIFAWDDMVLGWIDVIVGAILEENSNLQLVAALHLADTVLLITSTFIICDGFDLVRNEIVLYVISRLSTLGKRIDVDFGSKPSPEIVTRVPPDTEPFFN